MNLSKTIDHVLLTLACIFVFQDIILKKSFGLFLDTAWFFFCLYLSKKDSD